MVTTGIRSRTQKAGDRPLGGAADRGHHRRPQMSDTDSPDKNTGDEESNETLRCSQLTDKAEVVGLDTTDYGDDRIEVVSRLSVATLKLQLELLDTLGWETVDVLAVKPKEGQVTEHSVVAFRPPADGWLTDQAAVAAAPKSQPHGETIMEVDDD